MERLIVNVANQLLRDHEQGRIFSSEERAGFVQAALALAWQESAWQHYFRHGNRFGVMLSGGSQNCLDDWGISQVARSGFACSLPLNKIFFTSKGYCSVSKSLYYGLFQYYTMYLTARQRPCNSSPEDKLVGAYNLSPPDAACVSTPATGIMRLSGSIRTVSLRNFGKALEIQIGRSSRKGNWG